MKKRSIVDVFVVGFALFATFFGAGNLIFPPAIGLAAGDHWGSAIAGMTISAILLPILTVIATNNMGNDLSDLTKPVSSWFFSAYMFVFFLFCCIVGVPRQGGIAIETGVFSVAPGLANSKAALVIGLFIYFLLVFLACSNPGKVVDIVGKYLTPVLLVILLVIVVGAFVSPIGEPGAPSAENTFTSAFLQGYQTGDVMVGVVIASTFIVSIRARGYKSRSDVNKITLKAAAVAFAGLFVVYGGFCYLGATASQLYPQDIDQTLLLNSLVQTLTGSLSSKVFGIGVFLACLTTSIGVVSSTANMLAKPFKGKVPYKMLLAICCFISFALASMSVSVIIAYTTPTISLIYPVSIVLTLLGVFRKFVPNHGAWKGAVTMAVVIGAYEALNSLLSLMGVQANLGFLEAIYNAIPLSQYGFAWLLPSVLGFIAGALIVKIKKQPAYPMLGDENNS